MALTQIYTDYSGELREYEQVVRLDGSDFILKLSWNSRAGHWMLSLSTPAGASIVAGRTVANGVNLLRGAVHAERPSGVLFAAQMDNSDADAGLLDLGSRVALYYQEAETS
ncbi:MAG: hypothetical protein WC683_06235 [bacterium]